MTSSGLLEQTWIHIKLCQPTAYPVHKIFWEIGYRWYYQVEAAYQWNRCVHHEWLQSNNRSFTTTIICPCICHEMWKCTTHIQMYMSNLQLNRESCKSGYITLARWTQCTRWFTHMHALQILQSSLDECLWEITATKHKSFHSTQYGTAILQYMNVEISLLGNVVTHATTKYSVKGNTESYSLCI